MRAACPASLQGQAAPPPAIVAGIGVPEGPPRLLRSFEWSSDVRRKVSALTLASAHTANRMDELERDRGCNHQGLTIYHI